MQGESSLLNPYNFESRNLNYTFFADSGLEYYVYFTESSGYFQHLPHLDDEIITFGFYPKPNRSLGYFFDEVRKKWHLPRYDVRVKDTVVAIIQEFLLINPGKALMFSCDDVDGRDKCRWKLFKDWWNKTESVVEIATSSYESEIKDSESTLGEALIIIRNDNPQHEEIRDAFLNLSNYLIEKGNSGESL